MTTPIVFSGSRAYVRASHGAYTYCCCLYACVPGPGAPPPARQKGGRDPGDMVWSYIRASILPGLRHHADVANREPPFHELSSIRADLYNSTATEASVSVGINSLLI
jgi:hypothetical protein